MRLKISLRAAWRYEALRALLGYARTKAQTAKRTPPSADRKVRKYVRVIITPRRKVVLRSSIYDSPGPRARGRTMPPTTWQGAGKTL